MKKKILLVVAIFFLIPVSSAFAANDYTDGVLDEIGYEIVKGDSLVFDNDLTTFYHAKNTSPNPDISIILDRLVDIKDIYLSARYQTGSQLKGDVSFYDQNNNLIRKWTAPSVHFQNYASVSADGVKSIDITFTGSFNVYEFDIFGTYSEISYDPVTNLTGVFTHNSIDLSWINPEGVSNIVIRQNGVEVANLDAVNRYTIGGLKAETAYNFEVIAMYEGKMSAPMSISLTTDAAPLPEPEPEPVGEVVNLSANTLYNRVDLSWRLPESPDLKHVNIYRDTLNESFLNKIFSVKKAKAATKIFETNGTYFNDLTVDSETKYEYILTTSSLDDLESDGVSIEVTTPEKPIPEIDGGEYEEDSDTGDFVYSWTKPTTGKVKVMVGGKLYATVDASNLKITIPSGEMKYTLFGKPDVQLIAVDEDGDESKPVKPPESGGGGTEGGSGGTGDVGKIPFGATELIKTSFTLIGLFSGFILIALAIELVPRIIRVIKKTVEENKARGATK